MNRNFTRYQELPNIDALSVLVNSMQVETRTEPPENAARSCRGNEADISDNPSVPPACVGGHGVKPIINTTLARQTKFLRA